MEGITSHEVSLSAYLRILRRRKWILLVCAVIVPVAAYFVTASQPRVYQSSAQVYLSSADLAGALTGISASYVDPVQLADTQASLAQVPDVARRAIALSGVKGVTPDELLGMTSVVAEGDTSILDFIVVDDKPQRAARFATAYARAFTTYRGELDTSAIKVARQELATKLDELSSAGQTNSRLAISLRNKDQQLATLEALQTSKTYVIRTADGGAQIAPRPKKNAAIGLMLGIVLGIGLVFAIEALDTRVRSPREVGDRLDMPQLARVPPPPRDVQKNDRLVMIAESGGPSAEAFRMLRTNLDFATLDHDEIRTILITSAVEQEGKSTTAANLAIAEARAGHRVALVDLDLRLPYIDRFFELELAQGVTDVALGTIPLEKALRHIDLQTGAAAPAHARSVGSNGHGSERGLLDVLVAGALPPDPGEFVGSRRLGEILAQLHSAYDLVILDTPPVLRVGDAMTLSTHADGIVVVTRLNLIRRPMLSDTRRLLANAPALKLGFVVTGSSDHDDDGYGSGYGYGYGYGHKYGRGASNKRRTAVTSPAPAPQPEAEQPTPVAREHVAASGSAEDALARMSELMEKTRRP